MNLLSSQQDRTRSQLTQTDAVRQAHTQKSKQVRQVGRVRVVTSRDRLGVTMYPAQPDPDFLTKWGV